MSTIKVNKIENTSTADGGISIDSSGKVGVGVTSLSDIFHVGGDDAFIRVDRTNGNPGIDLRHDGSSTNRGVIDVTSSGEVRFAAGGSTERCRILAAGGLTFNGDTAAANALDDYEEGTWTPTCESDGSIGTAQYTCTYTKIGRLVTINCDIHALTDITSSNPIQIGGLPYSPSATSGELGSAAAHGERYGSSLIVAFIAYMSSQWVIRFRKGVGSSSYEDVDHSDINNAGDNNLRFSLTYEITA